MPGNKLKISSSLLMAYGVGNVLVGVAVLAVSLLAKEEVAEMLGSYQGLLGFMNADTLFMLVSVLYLMFAVLDLLAGICGFRFSDGKGSIRLCQIPAGGLIVIYSIDTLLKVCSGNFSSAVGPLLHAVVAYLCIKFAKKVEEDSVKSLMAEDTPVFHYGEDR